MSQPTCNQLPTTTQQMRPAPLPAFLFLLTPLRSILMANPPSLLCQELCSPNSHFPSSSPAPSHKPVCAWQREASVHLSADRFTGRSCTGQSGLVFSIFLFDSRKHRSPSTLALSFQNARCYSAFYSHHWTAHSESLLLCYLVLSSLHIAVSQLVPQEDTAVPATARTVPKACKSLEARTQPE